MTDSKATATANCVEPCPRNRGPVWGARSNWTDRRDGYWGSGSSAIFMKTVHCGALRHYSFGEAILPGLWGRVS